jgi:hypothetical protein
MMKRFLSLTALALIMGTVPALAADTSTTPPVQHGVSPDASNAAKMPTAGSPDQSGGAAEQSSAPPSSAAGSQSSNARRVERARIGSVVRRQGAEFGSSEIIGGGAEA